MSGQYPTCPLAQPPWRKTLGDGHSRKKKILHETVERHLLADCVEAEESLPRPDEAEAHDITLHPSCLPFPRQKRERKKKAKKEKKIKLTRPR